MNITGDIHDNVLTGTREADALNGQGGNDELRGRRGADELDGGLGIDLMIGGTGDDTYWVDDGGDHVRERLDEGFADLVYSTASSFRLSTNVENLILRGSGDIAGIGNDLVNIIIGNSGANRIDGGAGWDRLEGRDGDDIYIADADDSIIEFADGGLDTLRIVLGAFNYSMPDNVENAVILSNGGFDFLGNELDNVVNGSDANDEIRGNQGDDRLFGLAGDDMLEGSQGDDVLIGGVGKDTLYGRIGADRFAFRDGDLSADRTRTDSIADFHQEEADRIDLRGIDADTNMADDQRFRFIGTDAFNGTAGQLHYVISGTLAYVEGDTNGDGTADFSLRVSSGGSAITFVAHDFLL